MDKHDAEEYFYSLVKKKEKPKPRTCLRCRIIFNSRDRAFRFCPKCVAYKNSRRYYGTVL